MQPKQFESYCFQSAKMTCDSSAKADEESLKSTLQQILNTVSENEVMASDKIDTASKSFLSYAEKHPVFSNDCLEILVKFVTVASANDQCAQVESFHQTIVKIYQYASKMELPSEIVKKVSSFSVSIFTILRNIGGAYDVVAAVLRFHSLESSAESQQLLEMTAVQATRVYMKFLFTIQKKPSECSRVELGQLAALVAPLSLLVISRCCVYK